MKLAEILTQIVFSKCICHSRYLFVGQVMFSHQSDQMPQRSKVSKIALWKCSLNVFVIKTIFVFVFVVVVLGRVVGSCFLITLIKCFKGHKCLGCFCVFQKQNVTDSVSEWQCYVLSCPQTVSGHWICSFSLLLQLQHCSIFHLSILSLFWR